MIYFGFVRDGKKDIKKCAKVGKKKIPTIMLDTRPYNLCSYTNKNKDFMQQWFIHLIFRANTPKWCINTVNLEQRIVIVLLRVFTHLDPS